MALPATKKSASASLSPEILAKMDLFTDKLFELIEPQLEMILNKYIWEAQKTGNADVLMDLVNRIVGKASSRAPAESQQATTTINILTHGGSIDSYKLAAPRVVVTDPE